MRRLRQPPPRGALNRRRPLRTLPHRPVPEATPSSAFSQIRGRLGRSSPAGQSRRRLDPVALAVMNNRLASIAEEMGVVLGQTGYSPNIKERRDYSCALFDERGELVAQAAHIPVHLGSTPLSVRAAIERLDLHPGDVAALNDPFAGGTHLPDVTVVMPIFLRNQKMPFAYVANRAHHADIGGMAPGSMALSTEIYQEGFRLPPVKLMVGGEPARDIFELFLANTRVRDEREGDLRAQVAALQVGAERTRALVETAGRAEVGAAMEELKDYADRLMRAMLRSLKPGTYAAEDFLDDDGFGTGPIQLCVAIKIGGGRTIVDFSGSAPQVRGSVNANYAITLSATFYVMKCLAAEAVPANEGLMRSITVIAPEGTIVNALPPAAVAGGNVETSQRIVDVLFRAMAQAAPERVPAASSGSMSNLTIGGYDNFRSRHFSYYETIAGGVGAAPGNAGASGLHTHMTNTLNTPIEGLEAYYPMRVTEYRIRRGSGGAGEYRGGDGLVRELECLVESNVSVLSDRRVTAPWGLNGGGDGEVGVNWLIRNGTAAKLPGKANAQLAPGDRVRIETPGGGAWGRAK
jgi:N-methylhydantoinase B